MALSDGGEAGMTRNNTIHFIYDGECPMCSNAALAYRMKEKFGTLHLINAREIASDNPLMQEISARGIDLDEGMVIVHDGRYYHGKDALKFMARHGAPKGAFNIFVKSLFWSDGLCHISYPFMRATRNWLLRRKNIGRINNLK